jgi:hypothetical protein
MIDINICNHCQHLNILQFDKDSFYYCYAPCDFQVNERKIFYINEMKPCSFRPPTSCPYILEHTVSKEILHVDKELLSNLGIFYD